MAYGTQISAVVDRSTRDLLDRLVRSTGLKKGYVLEMALLHHLQALQELPAEAIIPPRIVLSRRGAVQVARRLSSPERPTRALRDLMRRHGH